MLSIGYVLYSAAHLHLSSYSLKPTENVLISEDFFTLPNQSEGGFRCSETVGETDRPGDYDSLFLRSSNY